MTHQKFTAVDLRIDSRYMMKTLRGRRDGDALRSREAERSSRAIERPLNNTLLKLMTVETDEVTRGRWIREAAVSIMEIEDIRLKPLDETR